MKKFGKYLTITLLLLLGLACVGLLYLFFVPNAQLFGIKYVSYNDKHYSEAYDSAMINKVVVNSHAYETIVVTSNTDNISVMVYANNIGFLLTKNSDVKIDGKIENNILTFNISEPHGATILNDSQIVVSVPNNKTFDLTLSNNKANTTIDSNIKINKFSYRTTHGLLNLNKASVVGDIDLDFGNAVVNFNNELVLNNNKIEIKANSGKFDASNHNLGDLTISKNDKSVFLLKNANVVNMNVESAGGRIEAESIGNINIVSTDTNIYVGTVRDGATIIMKKSGKVEIKSVDGAASITTDTGNIRIDKATSPLTLLTKHGNIDVLDTTTKVDATNTYGNINVVFNDTATSNSIDNLARLFIAKSETGKIICKGADRVDIKSTKNSHIELIMHDVSGSSSISANMGTIFVNVSSTSQYLLSTEARGAVSVNLSQISNIGTGGYTTGSLTQTYVNCTSSTNDLKISTQGNLTIRDTITAQLG